MATAPLLELRDGSGYSTALSFTTNQASVFLTGTITTDTATLQVSVNGGGFSQDANLLRVELNTFTFPNPAVYPTGFSLSPGINTVSFRTIDLVGGVSSASTATITRVTSFDLLDAAAVIPTGIKVRRNRDNVELLCRLTPNLTSPTAQGFTFRGFNLYASTSPAGVSGYYRVNDKIIPLSSTTYDEVLYSTEDYLALWSDSARKFLRVKITEEDEFGAELAVRLDQLNSLDNFFDKARFKGTLENYSLNKYAVFKHTRFATPGVLNSEQWLGVLDSAPLYYVFTSVFYNTSINTEYESAYSQEVLGTPLTLDTAILDLPSRTQTSIVTDYINLVGRVNSEISMIPGSTTRDVSIDPFASEAERLWFLMDYVHRAQSFLTLLQIDDATGSGTPDTVAASPYKTALKSALGYTTDDAVQGLLNRQFDKLAANVNKTRLSGRLASGQVIFYTPTRPATTLVVPANTIVTGNSVDFRVGGSYTLPATNPDPYYNFNTKRYELIVEVTAIEAGTVGNLPAGTITSAAGVPGLFVTNVEAMVGGTDVETNAELAARSILSFASVDTGTEGGYLAAAAEQTGIIKSKVIKSGDRLMMRDWDNLRQKHIGGKVDIYVQGIKERQVSEQFAFAFDLAQDIQCVVTDLATLTMRVLDSRVTPTTPIIELLNIPAQGLGIRNATVGQNYDMTGAVILDYQTFRLSTAVDQPETSLDDVIYADYRFRSDNQFIFGYQPVRRIASVVGELSGALLPTVNYTLIKTDDPLLEGESTIAKNYISVVQAAGKPAGNQIQVNDEQHILIGFVQEPLNSIGININTIRVFSADRLVEYFRPDDFDILEGTDRTPPKIVRSAESTIVSGQQVSVDYIKDENFTITYVVNDLLQQFQTTINNRRHVTADVLVKQALVNSVDIETTVQMEPGYSKDKVDPALRTSVSLVLNKRLIGQGIAQSDVIHAIDNSMGVDYEVVPLAKMAYADGSLILREPILSTYQTVASLESGGQHVYLLNDALNYPTTDNGGLPTEHKGVFQDGLAMKMVTDPLLVGSQVGQAYIIGKDGAVIPGLTTLATAKTIANRVLVSLSNSGDPMDLPTNHAYTVSYQVRGDKGPHDIIGSEVEYVDLGSLTVTYRAG